MTGRSSCPIVIVYVPFLTESLGALGLYWSNGDEIVLKSNPCMKSSVALPSDFARTPLPSARVHCAIGRMYDAACWVSRQDVSSGPLPPSL
jgi:hypothetical protein